MEGAAAAHVAALYQVPMVEIRAASNRVGDRDKARWDIPAAVRTVAEICDVLIEKDGTMASEPLTSRSDPLTRASDPVFQYVDAHCHLHDPRIIHDIPGIVQRAKAAEVTHMVTCATMEENFESTSALARQYPAIIPCYGIHPWFLESLSDTGSRC